MVKVKSIKPIVRQVVLFGKIFYKASIRLHYYNFDATKKTVELAYCALLEKVKSAMTNSLALHAMIGADKSIIVLRSIHVVDRHDGKYTASASALIKEGRSTRFLRVENSSTTPFGAIFGLGRK